MSAWFVVLPDSDTAIRSRRRSVRVPCATEPSVGPTVALGTLDGRIVHSWSDRA